MKAVGKGVGLGERGMCVVLDIMRTNMQIVVWEGNLCPTRKPPCGRKCQNTALVGCTVSPQNTRPRPNPW